MIDNQNHRSFGWNALQILLRDPVGNLQPLKKARSKCLRTPMLLRIPIKPLSVVKSGESGKQLGLNHAM